MTFDEKINKIHPTHILYTEHDFTVAEYRRRNLLAVAVCDDGIAICKQCGKKEGSLSVDHCHDTGGIRGLLCNQCNRALGMFRDSQDLLYKAYKYIKEYEDCH